jgi:hypothetical protein
VWVGGPRHPPFTLSTSKVVVYAPAERVDKLPLFLLYPYMYSVVERLPCSQTTFVIYITDPKQEGLYSMFFHNCFNYGKTHSADRQVFLKVACHYFPNLLPKPCPGFTLNKFPFLEKIISSDKKKALYCTSSSVLKI